jgi:sulfite reductase alpha subunit-like flavoprotein
MTLLISLPFAMVFHLFSRLQKSLAKDLFHGVRLAVFSLGDRAYGPQKFCVAGRKLAARLRQLGASLHVDPGYGDDGTPNGGVFCDLDQWLQTTLLPKLSTNRQAVSPNLGAAIVASLYHISQSKRSCNGHDRQIAEWRNDVYSNDYLCFFQSLCPLTAYQYDQYCNRSIADTSNEHTQGARMPLLARVVENRRITSADCDQDTRHLRFEVTSVKELNETSESKEMLARDQWSPEALPYRAGDIAVVLPSNSTRLVDAFLKVLPLAVQAMADIDLSVHYDSANNTASFPGVGYPRWPKKCTLRGWLTYCADIQALPEREDLRALANYCSNNSLASIEQQRKLVSLSEPKDSALYVDYILREKRCWSDVLYDFDSLRDEGALLTVEALFGLLSPIRPRDFSIASSPTMGWLATRLEASPKPVEFAVELCVAIVEGSTRLGRSFHGLCSKHLSELPVSADGHESLVPIWIRPGSFHGLPLGESRPLLCVGAGTGIAPLRAMIHEREAVLGLQRLVNSGTDQFESLSCDNVLVFGCRSKSSDFYYGEEWRSLQLSGRLTLLTAFSRDQRHKIYVQDALGSVGFGRQQLARHILKLDGVVCIAGGPKMARAVKEVIVESIAAELAGGIREAHDLLAQRQRLGSFSVEAWN